MSEREPSSSQARQYETLESSEKVRAVLACLMQPVTRELALVLAGVDFDQLQESDKAKVDAIFGDGIQRDVHEGFGDRYWLTPEDQAEVLQGLGVDPVSVNGRIADVLWQAEYGDGPV